MERLIGAEAQGYAIEIEHIMSTIFNCNRFGVGGIVNSDVIRRMPFTSMIHALTHNYATADKATRQKLENFIEELSYYCKWSIDDLLEFETNNKTIVENGIPNSYEIPYNNGQEAVENLINKFRSISVWK